MKQFDGCGGFFVLCEDFGVVGCLIQGFNCFLTTLSLTDNCATGR
jgi:hypothetical protein